MPSADPSTEDTLDLKLPPEVIALFAAMPLSAAGEGAERTTGPTAGQSAEGAAEQTAARTAGAGPAVAAAGPPDMPRRPDPADHSDLLDRLADWPAAATPAGSFRLLPVEPDRDLDLIARWMNDPAVAEFWELAGDPEVTDRHLRSQLDGDGRSVPCLGVLDGVPMSYWELYRADLDPLARHYPARPHDTGVHLLVGGVADRARGLGGTLLRAVSDLVLDNRPGCTRVVAEPDLRNTPSVAAFLTAGFRLCLELELPGKRAALMIRDRALRHRL
ncbi:GNAT family N-acetyltransferase [Streptomyces sp. V4-01]|uniref:Lysine N-acyltransferase MbtK n=1 Tax=Actinacidiphila polyblastidii TaxID=3110430 RepID=A0ABU7PJV1_9ACTN|nr:GNAT family N-acetyltransferase [Streptomyces sp. V4-01]